MILARNTVRKVKKEIKMVELRPAVLQLQSGPGEKAFAESMANICHRFVDVIERNKEDKEVSQFVNGPTAVAFELRRPTIYDLSMLACVAGRLKPDRIDYMHAHGDHCIVYWMEWVAEEKENKDEIAD